jgi:phosphatidylglycerophosphate synthase
MNLFTNGHVHLIVSDTPTTPTRVDRQLAAAVAVQLTLLAVLSVQVGLGLLGWLAGAAYALGLRTLLGGAARRAGATALGPADVVTLARASLVGGVTALVVDRVGSGAIPVATLVLLSSVALALDGVDGWVARRTRTVSALGARFDMEVDAFLVLMLSVHVAQTVTPWALVIGAMRYAFVVVSWLLPWLSGALPTRYSAKVVAAAQGIVLVVASAHLLTQQIAAALVVAALTALLWSFGKSVTWLWRARLIRCGAADPHEVRGGRVVAGSVTARCGAADPHGVRGGRVVAGSVTARGGAAAPALIRRGAADPHGVRGGRVAAGSVTAR